MLEGSLSTSAANTSEALSIAGSPQITLGGFGADGLGTRTAVYDAKMEFKIGIIYARSQLHTYKTTCVYLGIFPGIVGARNKIEHGGVDDPGVAIKGKIIFSTRRY